MNCDLNKTYYKLTDENHQTYGQTKWGENVTHKAKGEGELCTNGWIHVYDSKWIAVIMNSVHADFTSPILWECKCEGKTLNDNGLKRGVESCTTIQQIELPEISLEKRIEFAIHCALAVYKAESFVKWANDWLSGKDRTRQPAYVAYVVADAVYANANAYAAKAVYANANAAAAYAAKAVRANAYAAAKTNKNLIEQKIKKVFE